MSSSPPSSHAGGGVTVTCKDGHIQELRICLTRDLGPRPCGRDVARDCQALDAVIEPIP